MKVLITGINGFVGKYLRNALEEEGLEIYGIDIKSSDENIYSIDITDPLAINHCISEISPHFIIHLAAISRVDFNNPGLIYNINVNGTLNILQASATQKFKPKVLLVSSSQVYGIVEESLQPILEKTAVKPVNHYGASKAAAENIAGAFYHEYGLPLVIVRPFNHIGRGQNQHFVVPKVIQAFKKKEKEIELGNIHVERDFLDVRDVVDAYLKLLDNFPEGEVFNIASGKGFTISDIIQMLEKTTGHQLIIKRGENLIRKNEINSSIGDFCKIRKKFNWQPVFDVNETLEWILNEG